MRQYDVLFVADHFIMVTTIIVDNIITDKKDAEAAAWKRLADEYGDDWVELTKPFINQVSVEEPPIPEPGDPEDAGIERD